MPWRDERIRFGRHRGKRLGELDIRYLAWLVDNFKPSPVSWTDQRLAEALKQASKELAYEMNEVREEEIYGWVNPLDFGAN